MNTSPIIRHHKKLNNFLNINRFPKKYSAENIKQMVKSGTIKPIDLANYLEDANSMLFYPVEYARKSKD